MSTSKKALLIGLFVMSLSGKSFAETTTVNTNNVSTSDSTVTSTNTNNNTNVNTSTSTVDSTSTNTNLNTNVNTSTSTSTNTNNNTNVNINSGEQTFRNINSGEQTFNNNNVSTSTSTNTNSNTNVNINSGEQTFNNNNNTTSNNTNTNNNVNTSTSDNTNRNIQSGEVTNRNINESKIEQTVKSPPPTAVAPSMMSGGNSDLCTVGTSGAVQTQILGVASGGTVRDLNCERLKNAKTLFDMGMKVAAVATLCQDRRVFDAMWHAGTPCPFEGTIGEQARVAWETFPDRIPKEEKVKGDDFYKKTGWGTLLGVLLFLAL
jgi:hypothetical protein